jgi:hypothetical protein
MVSKPKPLHEKKKRKSTKSRRAILEKQIEDVVKLIIFWRDNQQCVQVNQDGHRCGNGLMWGHYIAQKQSNWLRLELGNVFVQCGNHNQLDFRGDKSYSAWFISTFGIEAAQAMEAERDSHRGSKKRSIPELEELLKKYDELYQNRFYIDSTFDGLMQGGYFGDILRLHYKRGQFTALKG